MVEYERLSVWTGVGVPVWTLATMLLATILSPSFSWTANDLSNLGASTDVATPLTIALFNGGLISGGLVGVAFTGALWIGSQHLVERLGAIPFALTVLTMAGVGVFPQFHPLHFPVAVSFFLLVSVTCWVYGAGNLLAGARRRGVATIGLGVLNLGVWVAWVQIEWLSQPGLAIPEVIGAFLFAGWTAATARWHLSGERSLRRPNS